MLNLKFVKCKILENSIKNFKERMNNYDMQNFTVTVQQCQRYMYIPLYVYKTTTLKLAFFSANYHLTLFLEHNLIYLCWIFVSVYLNINQYLEIKMLFTEKYINMFEIKCLAALITLDKMTTYSVYPIPLIPSIILSLTRLKRVICRLQ